ncbi:MAG: UPF0261 family protein [Chloroflexi bacterium]|nr:MAG: UPF0261 family protein [Chloroflexota bacterium]
MRKRVVILGSLDTKGQEIDFLRGVLRDQGGDPLVLDTGVLGEPRTAADISRHQVARSAGTTIGAIIEAGDKARALVVMAEGTARILRQMLAQGELGGVLSIGGSRGTDLGSRVMQSLPVGLPKLMVSTLASGHNTFGPLVGTRDVTMMPAVADVMGVNLITRPILTNAAAAIAAMSRVGGPVDRREMRDEGPVVAATMLGASTPLVEQIHHGMAALGCQVVAFHAVGPGGAAMEELVGEGLFDGVFDVTPAEMAAWVVRGPYAAGPERMHAAARMGLPQVVAPGGLDFIIEGPPDRLPERYRGRATMRHTSSITLVRTSPDELAQVALDMAARLAESSGPASAILPLCGFSAFGIEGQPLHHPVADHAFIETFKAHVPARVQVVELATHLNDPVVARTAVQLMHDMLKTSPAPAT